MQDERLRCCANRAANRGTSLFCLGAITLCQLVLLALPTAYAHGLPTVKEVQVELSRQEGLYQIPTGLLSAVCWVESRHRVLPAHLDGRTRSYGPCQIKLATARAFGFTGKRWQLSEPQTNIEYAARYFASLLKRYQGDRHKAICAYNRGKDCGKAHCEYVRKVLQAYHEGH